MDRLLQVRYDDLKYLYWDYVCPEATSIDWLIPRLIILKRIALCRKKSTNEIVLLTKACKELILDQLARPEEQTRNSRHVDTLRHHLASLIDIQEHDGIWTRNYRKFIEALSTDA